MFAEVGRQLDARGLIVREGTLDATLAAAVKPPKGDAGEASERDPQAGWTKKNGRSHFGYKAHIAVDKGSKIIRDAILTSAELHANQPAAELIQGDERGPSTAIRRMPHKPCGEPWSWQT